ncbi:IS3 family transposase [Myxococcus stipitatus]
MPRRERRKYTPEFKARAVKMVLEEGKSRAQVAKDMDLTRSALEAWMRQSRTDAGQGPSGALTTGEKEELAQLRREVRQLRMEREILKNAAGLLRQGEHVRFTAIQEEKANYPVAMLCRVLEVSRAGYYAWEGREASARQKANAALVERIQQVHQDSRRTYGSPRVQAELKAQGLPVGRHRVARLMREAGLRARRRRRFVHTTDSKHGLPVAPNVLARAFNPPGPDQTWATDITYVPTREGWLYLAVVLDLFSRRVIGWAMDRCIDRHLVLSALDMALKGRCPPAGLLHHSDRGSQYASEDYQRALAARGIRCSMSRKGNCWDNAVVESFFSTLKTELVHDADFSTREAAKGGLFEFIEVFYNRKRRHSSLGYVSPAEFEKTASQVPLAA